jgi:hypothetical protein
MDELEFEIVPLSAAKEVLDAVPGGPAKADWQIERRGPPVREAELSQPAIRWLAGLPEHARPMKLCRLYPRIGNNLAALWSNVKERQDYVMGLLFDERGGRQGFCSEVVEELTALRLHHEQTSGANKCVWNV